MAEKMLVTQALDERDLLVKKIRDKIENASFTDIKKRNESKVIDSRTTEEHFKQKSASAYQQIMDLVDRFQTMDAAIVASNAATMIQLLLGIIRWPAPSRSEAGCVDPAAMNMKLISN